MRILLTFKVNNDRFRDSGVIREIINLGYVTISHNRHDDDLTKPITGHLILEGRMERGGGSNFQLEFQSPEDLVGNLVPKVKAIRDQNGP